MNNTTLTSTYRGVFMAAFCSIVFSGFSSAYAGAIVEGNVVLNISGSDGKSTESQKILIPITSDGKFGVFNQPTSSPFWNGTIDDASGNVDPFTNLNFSILNTAVVPVEYLFSITLPIAPIVSATVHGGSVVGGTTDANKNGAGGLSTITSTAGVPFYAGQIDGSTVLSIYPDVTSFSFIFGGQSISIPALNPGLPGPTLPSGAALATIGIVQRFKLSPGDSMSSTSFFQVEAIPEPSTIALAILGGTGLLWFARRRRRR